MTLPQARKLALTISADNDCAQHINVVIGKVGTRYKITGYRVSDWFVSEATVESYESGRSISTT